MSEWMYDWKRGNVGLQELMERDRREEEVDACREWERERRAEDDSFCNRCDAKYGHLDWCHMAEPHQRFDYWTEALSELRVDADPEWRAEVLANIAQAKSEMPLESLCRRGLANCDTDDSDEIPF